MPKPKATDKVKVEYTGTKIDGTKFDATADHNPPGPATFPLNGVIPGWTEGMQLMTVGSEYKFYVPANLAYKDRGPPAIGPNATLIFDVKLLGIEPADAGEGSPPPAPSRPSFRRSPPQAASRPITDRGFMHDEKARIPRLFLFVAPIRARNYNARSLS